ncbi:MAG TPA: MAPEG family protein, partial [Parvularculaceae bacterium]|nr:MAPEG family protein [Parvularculaceae bacterium]
IVLVVLLAAYRVSLVSSGKKASPNFSPDGDDVEGIGRRLTRAHANCYENLPLAGAVLLYAIATNQTAITDGLATIFLGARLLQSLTHIASTNRNAVTIRFLFYVAQVLILAYWIFGLAHLI